MSRVEKVPICNSWTRNLGKLILSEVFVVVDLVKVLRKCYNIVNKSFHRKDRSIFLALDKETFIEEFDLTGPMSWPIDIEKFNKKFQKS